MFCFLFYVAEQDVDGPAFIEFTEESLRSNFPKINFGQRRECMKIIKSILECKEKFIFSAAEIQDDSNEIYDAAAVKAMNPTELSEFLQHRCHNGMLPETIQSLLTEEVDGESFLEFTDDSLLANFPEISLNQRILILNVIANAGELHYDATFQFGKNDVIELPLEEDLGCNILQGFLDDNGVLKAITGATSQKVDVAPCFSASFLKKRKKKSIDAKKKPKVNPEDVKPLDVLKILKPHHEGMQVIEFIRTNQFCDLHHQKIMMHFLYLYHSKETESPYKYYPFTQSKIAMAKGIVTDFPELADKIGDCEWASWLEVVKTKFETIQSKLPPNRKKNTKSTSTNCDKPKKAPSARTSKQASSSSTSMAPYETEISEETVNNQVSIMKQMLPSSQNKQMICLALSQTYSHRRKWILSDQPSVTEIIRTYKHLKSYEGEMISEEFRRIHKLHDDVFEKFKRSVPFIIAYAKSAKPNILEEVSKKFTNDNVKALVLLTKLLTVTLNKNTSCEKELEHVKDFKVSIESIPSSALFQVVPEGTDVESCVSIETHPVPSEQDTPIFPFLLWVTKDFNSGMFYMKIDKLCFFIGRVEDEDSIIRAFDVFVKAHHVFMVKYHPYLKTTVYDYFEYLYSIKKPLSSVSRFITAIRNVAN